MYFTNVGYGYFKPEIKINTWNGDNPKGQNSNKIYQVVQKARGYSPVHME